MGTLIRLPWAITPRKPVIGVQVRAGEGALIPAALSTLKLGSGPALSVSDARFLGVMGLGLPQVNAHLSAARLPDQSAKLDARFFTPLGNGLYTTPQAVPVPPAPRAAWRFVATVQVLNLSLSLTDLRAALPAGKYSRVVATLIYKDGTRETFTRLVLVDAEPPTGEVSALVTAQGTYYSYRTLSLDAVQLNVTLEGGQTLSLPVTAKASGLLHSDVLGTPNRVTATDAGGLEGGNLLVHVSFLTDPSASGTPISAWPLPTYLDPAQPTLKALLGAFARALSIGVDTAGTALSLDAAPTWYLDPLAQYFGVTRRYGDTDADLARRAKSVLTLNKSSLRGLKTMLDLAGHYGAEVIDNATQYVGEQALFLDGSWTLDGSKLLNGGTFRGSYIFPGEVLALYRATPATGLTAALATLRRYVAAGVRARVALMIELSAAVMTPPRVDVRRQWSITVSLPLTRAAPGLYLDGTWTLDGQQILDGDRR